MKFSAYSLTRIGYRILLIGLICCLIGALIGFTLMLLPPTGARLHAVEQIMSFTCRVLVLTVLTTVAADLLAKRR